MRVRIAWAAAIVVAGCGRLGFGTSAGQTDASADTRPVCIVGHDEDTDGVDDCTDDCPHIPDSSQIDSDGDGVGDACDPGTAVQHLLYFTPLAGSIPFVTGGTGVWTTVPDGLYFDGTGRGVAILPLAVRDVDIWIGVRIDAVNPGGPPQLTISLNPGMSAPHYYVELYQPTGSAPYVAVSHFDGTSYSVVMSKDLTAVPLGQAALRLGVRAGPAQMIAVLTRSGMTDSAFANVPGYDGSPQIVISAGYFAVELQYLAVIETLP